MEDRMLQEFGRLAETIGKTNGEPLDISDQLLACAFNNIVSFFYGAQLTDDHPTRRELHRLAKQLGLALMAGPQDQFLPWTLRRLLAWLPFTRKHRIADFLARLDAVSMKLIQESKAWLCQDETKGVIPGYMKKIEESKAERNPSFTGRRACPGDRFATMEVFLMITFLLQKYRVLPDHRDDFDMDSPDFILSPFSPPQFRFLPRVNQIS
ncbi:hypothetical protein MTO96_029474 [Rhipicephalus appendiculatus]